jgi:hypothetical protein
MPIKFKEFYLKWNAIDKIEAVASNISNNVNNVLLKMFGEAVSFEIAVSITRDLALLLPSKHVLNILTRFLTTFKESKQISILKTQIVRTLNLILIRTPKEQINNTIKITLPTLIKEHLMNESQVIFENVPE